MMQDTFWGWNLLSFKRFETDTDENFEGNSSHHYCLQLPLRSNNTNEWNSFLLKYTVVF